MWIFSIMATLMVIGTVACYCVLGYLPDMYIHVSAYGFILAGMGYMIELMKKREKNIEEHVEWILEKKFKAFSEETKATRTMILKLEERREQTDFSSPTPMPYVNNEAKQIFSAPIPPTVFSKMKQNK